MTVFHPCHNCHRKAGCEILVAKRKAIRGLGITKANVKCKIPERDFPPGSIVDVKAFEIDYELQNKHAITVRGVVRAWKSGKASITIKKDDEIVTLDGHAIGNLRVTSERMKATDLPPVTLCPCGLSQERCENSDYPSIKSGEWVCQEQMMRYCE